MDDSESLQALEAAADEGVNFFDTADVYGDGHSEQLIAELRENRLNKDRSSSEEPRLFVATKDGRRLDPHTAEGHTYDNLKAFVDRSRQNLGVETLGLVQLHCPPTEAYYRPEVFEALEDLKAEEKIQHAGVSVEKVEEALKASEYPVVETVQIVFNMFRQRPADLFFEVAKARDIGVIARVPLASGLLTGKYGPESIFPENDHRNFNRNGEAFNQGETFAGVDLSDGAKATRELEEICPDEMTMAQFALRWILMFDAVCCTNPGAKRPDQARENASAADLPPLSGEQMREVEDIYERHLRDQVHHKW